MVIKSKYAPTQLDARTEGMMPAKDAVDGLRCLTALDRVHDILLDTDRNCVDRVSVAWLGLRDLMPQDVPASLRQGWTDITERVRRLAAESANPPAPANLDEAGDIGTILLCFESILQRDRRSDRAA